MRALWLLVLLLCTGCVEATTHAVKPAAADEPTDPVTAQARDPQADFPEVDAEAILEQEIVPEKLDGPDPVALSIVEEPIFRDAAKCVAFSPDGRWLVIGHGDGLVRLWNVAMQQVDGEWPAHDNWTFDLQFSMDSQSLWTGGGDNRVRRWDVATGKVQERFEDHEDDVHGVAVSTDGTLLVSGADDHMVVVRNLQTGDVDALEGHTAQVTSIAIGASDSLIASGSRDGSARIWDIETRKTLHELRLDDKHVLCVAFDHDGKRLLTAGRDNAAHIWDVATGELLHTFGEHGNRVFTAVWLNGDEVIATGSQDRHLRLIRVSDGEIIVDELMSANVADIALSPDGTLLAAALSDGNVRLFETDGTALTPAKVIPPSSRSRNRE